MRTRSRHSGIVRAEAAVRQGCGRRGAANVHTDLGNVPARNCTLSLLRTQQRGMSPYRFGTVPGPLPAQLSKPSGLAFVSPAIPRSAMMIPLASVNTPKDKPSAEPIVRQSTPSENRLGMGPWGTEQHRRRMLRLPWVRYRRPFQAFPRSHPVQRPARLFAVQARHRRPMMSRRPRARLRRLGTRWNYRTRHLWQRPQHRRPSLLGRHWQRPRPRHPRP